MTREQAKRIARQIYGHDFKLEAGGDHVLDLAVSEKEFTKILLLADSLYADEHLDKYYEQLNEPL